MSLETFIAHYGLLAVGFGAGVEGETAVMTGGVFARQGALSLSGVACAAATGSFLADQSFFLLGRHFRERTYVQRLLAKPAARRAFSLLERYPNRFILSIRFIYGLRTLSPIAVGASHIPQARFLLLNAVAAVVWAILFSVLGYQVGDALRAAFQRVHPYSHVVLAASAIGLALFVSFRLLCRYLHHRAGERGAGTTIGIGGSPKLG